jgi:hypothetical protein
MFQVLNNEYHRSFICVFRSLSKTINISVSPGIEQHGRTGTNLNIEQSCLSSPFHKQEKKQSLLRTM